MIYDSDSEDLETLRNEYKSWDLTYPGWEEDFDRVEKANNDGNTWRRERLLTKLQKRQAVHVGDRSHPQLVALDSVQLSYPGWQDDIQECEYMHYEYDGKVFWDKLDGLKNKQRSFLDDRSHPHLMELDSLEVDYPGWEDDYWKAEDAHNDGNERRFRRFVDKMKKTQCIYMGDRSHPRLKALDSLKLSYPNCKNDIKDAERIHCEFEGKTFWEKLEGMKSKEKIFKGDRSCPNLKRLDALQLSYPGWKQDMKKAEDAHMNGNEWRFKRFIELMLKRESDYENNKHGCGGRSTLNRSGSIDNILTERKEVRRLVRTRSTGRSDFETNLVLSTLRNKVVQRRRRKSIDF